MLEARDGDQDKSAGRYASNRFPAGVSSQLYSSAFSCFNNIRDYWIDACQRAFCSPIPCASARTLIWARRTKPRQTSCISISRRFSTGRRFPHPVNYQLMRIVPPKGTVTEPAKRPFIVFDPRAGHGPGIGGIKQDSEIGRALKAGHPCYFTGFLPEPVPTQTIEHVCEAEAIFVAKVIELHQEASQPCLIGNCQAGWQVAMMAALNPELPGVLILAGTPMSYWAGVHGKNPMRYRGGMLGGSWLATLWSDLGNGRFDGAWLIDNFEQLNPANTYWKKVYNLYSKVDTEAPRYLAIRALVG